MSGLVFDPKYHRYTLRGISIPSVTHVIDRCGLCPNKDFYNEKARERGSAVHAICQFHDNGELKATSVDKELAPYFDAYKLFLDESKFQPTIIEQPMASEYPWFAGTPDRIGYLEDTLVLLDIKTGGYYPHYDLQLAGYAILMFNNLGQKPESRFTIQLSDTGKYRKIEPSISDEYADGLFVSAANFLPCLNWKESTYGSD